MFLTTFEPFVTFNILDLVVSHDFTMSLWTVLEGAAGQVLLVPSAFGIDSNSFNTEFTAHFVPVLKYGIAGNYWAQAWAVGGPAAIGVYAVLYAAALRCCDFAIQKFSVGWRIGFVLIGALLAVYVHRNALDNLLSFVRQIAIVLIAVTLPASALAPFVQSVRRPTRLSEAGRDL